jgi:hypothetical protein
LLDDHQARSIDGVNAQPVWYERAPSVFNTIMEGLPKNFKCARAQKNQP